MKPAVALSLIMLTTLDGRPVLVEATQVIIVRQYTTECGHGHGSAIRVGTIGMCVKETQDEVKQKIERAKQ